MSQIDADFQQDHGRIGILQDQANLIPILCSILVKNQVRGLASHLIYLRCNEG